MVCSENTCMSVCCLSWVDVGMKIHVCVLWIPWMCVLVVSARRALEASLCRPDSSMILKSKSSNLRMDTHSEWFLGSKYIKIHTSEIKESLGWPFSDSTRLRLLSILVRSDCQWCSHTLLENAYSMTHRASSNEEAIYIIIFNFRVLVSYNMINYIIINHI